MVRCLFGHPITDIGYINLKEKEVVLMSVGCFGNNGFILLVVLFILLIIVGNSYPMGGGFGGGVY
jgi:uncharacterized protein (TIGR01732 family)